MGEPLLKTCDPNLQVIIAVLIGLDLAKELDVDEQNILANLLNVVAAVISTISTIEDVQDKVKKDTENEEGQNQPTDQQEEAGETALHKPPQLPSTPPQEHRRMLEEQQELRRQIVELQAQVRLLEARLNKNR